MVSRPHRLRASPCPSWWRAVREEAGESCADAAARAKARGTVEIAGASHLVGVSHPAETARIILEAAGSHALADA